MLKSVLVAGPFEFPDSDYHLTTPYSIVHVWSKYIASRVTYTYYLSYIKIRRAISDLNRR